MKRSTMKVTLFLTLMFSLVLVSCGGGGGGGGTGGGGNTPDTTPPTVSSTSPADSATSVAVSTTVSAVFSESLDAATVTNATFLLTGPSGTVAGTASASGATATFTPSGSLATSVTYTAEITTGVKDKAGNALAAARAWSFTTTAGGAKSWGSVVSLETGTGQAYAPQIAMDGNGNAFAVWRQYDVDSTGDRVFANRYTAGVGWGAAAIIQSSTDPSAPVLSPPRVAADANGNAIAVWEEFDPGAPGNTNITSIWACRYTVGVGWGTAEIIENVADTSHDPRIAMDGNGNAIVVWLHDNYSIHQVWANRYLAGVGWGTEARIDNAGYSNYPPQLGVDGSGNAVALWNQYNGVIASNIFTAGSGTAGSWGTAAQLVASGRDPQVSMNSGGAAVAIWAVFDGTFYRIYSKKYTSGSGWGADELIDSDTTNDVGYPQVAVDSSGNAFAVWMKFDGARYHIYTAKHPALTTWGTNVRIDSDTYAANYPQISVNGNGDAFAVWYQSDGTRYNAWSNHRLSSDSVWGTAELIENDNTGSAYDPQIAVDASGNALAVWRQNDGTRDNIVANRYQ